MAKTRVQAPPRFLGESSSPTEANAAVVLTSGFQQTTVISGLTNPTVVRFASDGRIFVAEKSGVVKVFDSLTDTSPTVVADLSAEVDDYWDRGLLGMALDPNFPASPYVYLLYTYDAPPGKTAPTWNDGCATPPGPTTDGCVASGRLVRIMLSGDVISGSPQVLIKDEWCQQYPSHSVGDLVFGPDGALYVSAGDGASFAFADYGQGGGSLAGTPTPKNPCGDPPAGVGGTQTPPTAEGGALRTQSPRRATGEPVLLNGTILRVDPATGAGLPDNPNGGSSDANTKRIVAHGLRNPFRFSFRPGTGELWIGDASWNTWEEINRRVTPTGAVQNFGWPCYEGNEPQPGYRSAGLNICTDLYNDGSASAPYYRYQRGFPVVSGDNCPTANGSVVSAVAFYDGGSYPPSFNGALFFGDHSRNCIWAIPIGSNGLPDPTKVQTFVRGAANPVDLEVGPGRDLYYVNFDGGTIERISYVDSASPDKALGRPASASSSETSALTPEKANDGDVTTRWSSASADDQWWQVDLGSLRQVDTVSLNWEAAYASSYKLQVSPDGSTFTDVASVSTAQPGWQTTTFPAVGARYVRVLGVTRAIQAGISFWDAQVFGPPDSGGTVPVDLSPPTASGFAGQGQTLTASTGEWSTGAGAPTAYAYQWERCDGAGTNCQAITAATAQTYRLAAPDVGQTVRVAVVASNGAGSSPPAYSAVTDVVKADVALLQPASASSSETSALTPEKANDGDVTTRWSSASADDQWWQVDLGSLRQVDTVSLNWEAAYASSYKLQVSPDGSTFTDVASVSTAQPGWQTTTFPAVGARYVRVLGVTRAIQAGISFWDAQVFGSASATSPVAVIDTPSPALTWAVGDPISFSGHAVDPVSGQLSASDLTWTEIIHHCTTPSTCHTHTVQTFTGVDGGSLNAPDHDYPSWLELQLTATSPSGETGSTSIRLDPKTVDLTFTSDPTGLTLAVGSSTSVTPFTRSVIVNSTNSISAPLSQTLDGTDYSFVSWSDGGAATHNITAPAGATEYSASYTALTPALNTSLPRISGQARQGRMLTTTDGSWSGEALTFSYQWRRCDSPGADCVDIENATASSYRLTSSDVRFRIRSRVTATNDAGSTSADSAPSPVIKPGR